MNEGERLSFKDIKEQCLPLSPELYSVMTCLRDPLPSDPFDAFIYCIQDPSFFLSQLAIIDHLPRIFDSLVSEGTLQKPQIARFESTILPLLSGFCRQTAVAPSPHNIPSDDLNSSQTPQLLELLSVNYAKRHSGSRIPTMSSANIAHRVEAVSQEQSQEMFTPFFLKSIFLRELPKLISKLYLKDTGIAVTDKIGQEFTVKGYCASLVCRHFLPMIFSCVVSLSSEGSRVAFDLFADFYNLCFSTVGQIIEMGILTPASIQIYVVYLFWSRLFALSLNKSKCDNMYKSLSCEIANILLSQYPSSSQSMIPSGYEVPGWQNNQLQPTQGVKFDADYYFLEDSSFMLQPESGDFYSEYISRLYYPIAQNLIPAIAYFSPLDHYTANKYYTFVENHNEVDPLLFVPQRYYEIRKAYQLLFYEFYRDYCSENGIDYDQGFNPTDPAHIEHFATAFMRSEIMRSSASSDELSIPTRLRETLTACLLRSMASWTPALDTPVVTDMFLQIAIRIASSQQISSELIFSLPPTSQLFYILNDVYPDTRILPIQSTIEEYISRMYSPKSTDYGLKIQIAALNAIEKVFTLDSELGIHHSALTDICDGPFIGYMFALLSEQSSSFTAAAMAMVTSTVPFVTFTIRVREMFPRFIEIFQKRQDKQSRMNAMKCILYMLPYVGPGEVLSCSETIFQAAHSDIVNEIVILTGLKKEEWLLVEHGLSSFTNLSTQFYEALGLNSFDAVSPSEVLNMPFFNFSEVDFKDILKVLPEILKSWAFDIYFRQRVDYSGTLMFSSLLGIFYTFTICDNPAFRMKIAELLYPTTNLIPCQFRVPMMLKCLQDIAFDDCYEVTQTLVTSRDFIPLLTSFGLGSDEIVRFIEALLDNFDANIPKEPFLFEDMIAQEELLSQFDDDVMSDEMEFDLSESVDENSSYLNLVSTPIHDKKTALLVQKWRNRMYLLEQLPDLLVQFGATDSKTIIQFFLWMLFDPVADIRNITAPRGLADCISTVVDVRPAGSNAVISSVFQILYSWFCNPDAEVSASAQYTFIVTMEFLFKANIIGNLSSNLMALFTRLYKCVRAMLVDPETPVAVYLRILHLFYYLRIEVTDNSCRSLGMENRATAALEIATSHSDYEISNLAREILAIYYLHNIS